jgi:hypothetical protein
VKTAVTMSSPIRVMAQKARTISMKGVLLSVYDATCSQ